MGLQVARMKEMRIKRGIAQSGLAEMMHLARSTIAMWESGRSEPSSDMYIQLSQILGCTVGYLMGIENSPTPDDDVGQIIRRRVPILGDIAAGEPIIANRVYDEYVEIPDDGEHRYDAALRVTGDSMAPKYQIGDLVLVRYQDDVNDGQIAAVCLDDTVTLKRIYHIPHGLQLISDNPQYQPMIFMQSDVNNAHLLGLAVGVLHFDY